MRRTTITLLFIALIGGAFGGSCLTSFLNESNGVEYSGEFSLADQELIAGETKYFFYSSSSTGFTVRLIVESGSIWTVQLFGSQAVNNVAPNETTTEFEAPSAYFPEGSSNERRMIIYPSSASECFVFAVNSNYWNFSFTLSVVESTNVPSSMKHCDPVPSFAGEMNPIHQVDFELHDVATVTYVYDSFNTEIYYFQGYGRSLLFTLTANTTVYLWVGDYGYFYSEREEYISKNVQYLSAGVPYSFVYEVPEDRVCGAFYLLPFGSGGSAAEFTLKVTNSTGGDAGLNGLSWQSVLGIVLGTLAGAVLVISVTSYFAIKKYRKLPETTTA